MYWCAPMLWLWTIYQAQWEENIALHCADVMSFIENKIWPCNVTCYLHQRKQLILDARDTLSVCQGFKKIILSYSTPCWHTWAEMESTTQKQQTVGDELLSALKWNPELLLVVCRLPSLPLSWHFLTFGFKGSGLSDLNINNSNYSKELQRTPTLSIWW